MDLFTQAYLTAALFTEDPHPGQGEYQPDLTRIAAAAITLAEQDCSDFFSAHEDEIQADVARAGHDFWLTRNGHGCGFWDGDWPEPLGGRLTRAAQRTGECEAYWGDDDKLHFLGE